MGESERVRESTYTLIFAEQALKDFAFHRKAGNQATIKRIERILQNFYRAIIPDGIENILRNRYIKCY